MPRPRAVFRHAAPSVGEPAEPVDRAREEAASASIETGAEKAPETGWPSEEVLIFVHSAQREASAAQGEDSPEQGEQRLASDADAPKAGAPAGAPDFQPTTAFMAANIDLFVANLKVGLALQAILADNLEFGRMVARAPSLPDAWALQARHLQTVLRQTADLAALMRQASSEAAVVATSLPGARP